MGEDLSHGDEVLRPYLVRPFSNGNAVNLLTDLEPALYRMVRLVKDLGRIDSIFCVPLSAHLLSPFSHIPNSPGKIGQTVQLPLNPSPLNPGVRPDGPACSQLQFLFHCLCLLGHISTHH